MEKVIDRIRQNIKQLKHRIHLIPDDIMDHKPRPEKWSRKEILGHLVDSARYNHNRFTEIQLAETETTIIPYAMDDLVRLNDYQSMNLAELVNLWQSLNQQIIRVISRIPEAKLQNKIRWKDVQYDLDWLITDYADHMDHHLTQILAPSGHMKPLPCKLAIDQVMMQFSEDQILLEEQLTFADLEVELYRPKGKDLQTTHSRDEVYVIVSGSGTFLCNEVKMPIKTGDLLFAKAGDIHRFENFSEDFCTWVLFYGLHR